MSNIRVLMANEPRAYREAIALALEASRPDAEVLTIEPETLDDEVRHFLPRLVICSHVTAVVEAEVPVWIELYPEHGASSTVSFGGRRSTIPAMEMEDLIRIFDHTQSLFLGAV